MARIRVQRPQSVSEALSSLSGVALVTFVALKLAGVVTWSWWWVLSPLWIGVAPLALLAGGLVILWCLGQWPFILVDRWRVRRQARSFFRLEPFPVPSTVAPAGMGSPGPPQYALSTHTLEHLDIPLKPNCCFETQVAAGDNRIPLARVHDAVRKAREERRGRQARRDVRRGRQIARIGDRLAGR